MQGSRGRCAPLLSMIRIIETKADEFPWVRKWGKQPAARQWQAQCRRITGILNSSRVKIRIFDNAADGCRRSCQMAEIYNLITHDSPQSRSTVLFECRVAHITLNFAQVEFKPQLVGIIDFFVVRQQGLKNRHFLDQRRSLTYAS